MGGEGLEGDVFEVAQYAALVTDTAFPDGSLLAELPHDGTGNGYVMQKSAGTWSFFELDPSGAAVPVLADSFTPNDDFTEWTFTIRDDATWEDGQPVTAEEVAFGICRSLDSDAFPAVRLARSAGETGGVAPAIYNAANEEAVAAFTAGRLSFPGIVQLVARTLDEAPDLGVPTRVEDVLAAEKWAREHARGIIAGG